MEITQNESEFDKRQLHLIREIIRSIKNDLENAHVPAEQLQDLTSNIAFSIAAIIDGSRVMRADGRSLIPMLTFADDDQRTKLVARPGGSFMHEYVDGTVDDVF